MDFQWSKADPVEKKYTHDELKVSKGKPADVDPVSWIQLEDSPMFFFFLGGDDFFGMCQKVMGINPAKKLDDCEPHLFETQVFLGCVYSFRNA